MVTDTAFHRNPWYHTGRDMPETLDYPPVRGGRGRSRRLLCRSCGEPKRELGRDIRVKDGAGQEHPACLLDRPGC